MIGWIATRQQIGTSDYNVGARGVSCARGKRGKLAIRLALDVLRRPRYPLVMRISLSPGLDQFVAEKVRSGAYVDAEEVIRDGLRRWKEQEETLLEPAWLEEEIQEGLESEDLPQEGFWDGLRRELHNKVAPKAKPRRR